MTLLSEQQALARVCAKMTARGVRLDLSRLAEVEKQMADDKLAITGKFSINLRSADQIIGYFDEHYKIKLPDTRKDTIKDYALRHPEIPEFQAVADFKDLGKDLQAWFGPKYLQGERVHPRWNPTGTVERRLSCSAPNFQNVPHRNPYFSNLMRSVVIPEPGCVLVEFDASQGEDWSTGFAAQDKKLLGDLISGMDFHARTAEYIFGHPCPKKTHKRERDIGKMWNHAHKYGQGFKFAYKGTRDYHKIMDMVNKGLMIFGWDGGDYIVGFSASHLAELTWGDRSFDRQRDALKIKRQLMRDYSGIVTWQKNTFEHWRQHGTVRNPYGFGRPLYGREDECAKRGYAFIGASTLQTPVIRAMIECDAAGYWQSAQIHDSLLFSFPEGRVEEDIALVRNICETDREGLRVPWEAKVGGRWSECE